MNKKISIVAPMYNEEALVHEYCEETIKVVDRLKDRYNFEIILVNDGSRDNTYKEMLEEQEKNPTIITTICLSRNFGLEGAVNAGLRKALGDAVIVMDADLQDPPSLIPDMIEKWANGADVVVCSRIKRSNDSFFKKFSAGVYYKILDSLSGKLKLEKSAANFRLLSRKALDVLLQMPESNCVFRVTVPYVGMRTEILEYDRDKRFAGHTKYNLKNMIPYALASITGISVEPLRKLFWLLPLDFFLFLISIIGLILGIGFWRGIFLVIAAMSIFTAMVLVASVIVAEYVAQIMIEVKGRPISIIYKYIPAKMTDEEGSR